MAETIIRSPWDYPQEPRLSPEELDLAAIAASKALMQDLRDALEGTCPTCGRSA